MALAEEQQTHGCDKAVVCKPWKLRKKIQVIKEFSDLDDCIVFVGLLEIFLVCLFPKRDPSSSGCHDFIVNFQHLLEDASLVFLGTDEGDVRAFDAGDSPHMASYTVPCTAIYGRKDRPCPVAAMSVSPTSTELIIANGEGGLLLWSFEKHRSLRSFDSMSGVTSVLWCRSGSHFLAASRNDISLFSRSSASAVARISLPGGSCAQGVSLLHWDSPMVAESTTNLGELWLRRSAPNPSLQHFSGENWSSTETVMQDVLGATSFRFGKQLKQCGCPAMPSSALFTSASDLISDSSQVAMVVVQAYGTGSRFMVAAGKTYPLTWGSLPLADLSCMEMIPSRALEAKSEATPVVEEAPPSEGRNWMVCNGELKAGISIPPSEFGTDDGWFVCSGPENADEPEAVQWQLLETPQMKIQSEISLGLDAKVGQRKGEHIISITIESSMTPIFFVWCHVWIQMDQL